MKLQASMTWVFYMNHSVLLNGLPYEILIYCYENCSDLEW